MGKFAVCAQTDGIRSQMRYKVFPFFFCYYYYYLRETLCHWLALLIAIIDDSDGRVPDTSIFFFPPLSLRSIEQSPGLSLTSFKYV